MVKLTSNKLRAQQTRQGGERSKWLAHASEHIKQAKKETKKQSHHGRVSAMACEATLVARPPFSLHPSALPRPQPAPPLAGISLDEMTPLSFLKGLRPQARRLAVVDGVFPFVFTSLLVMGVGSRAAGPLLPRHAGLLHVWQQSSVPLVIALATLATRAVLSQAFGSEHDGPKMARRQYRESTRVLGQSILPLGTKVSGAPSWV